MKIFSNLIMVLIPLLVGGQSISDAINWSFENESGNARYQSMAGAFGALGGNLSAISNNPASSAVFELSRFGRKQKSQNCTNKYTLFEIIIWIVIY
mgnify:CR=1 FL=1